MKKIKILTENNEALELQVKSLTEKNMLKDNKIDELKQENKKVIDLIYETKALTYKTKEMLEGLIKIIIKTTYYQY